MWKDVVPDGKTMPFKTKSKSSDGSAKKSAFADDMAEEDVSMSDGGKGGLDEDEDDSDLDNYDDLKQFIVDDEDGKFDFDGEVRREHRRRGLPTVSSGRDRSFAPQYSFPPLQDAFQPNATPMRGGRQYLGEPSAYTHGCIQYLLFSP